MECLEKIATVMEKQGNKTGGEEADYVERQKVCQEIVGEKISLSNGPLAADQMKGLLDEFSRRGVTKSSSIWPLLSGRLFGIAGQTYKQVDAENREKVTEADFERCIADWSRKLGGKHNISMTTG